jgi:hypothetical protein
MATEAAPNYHPSEVAVAACYTADLARIGNLIYLARQDAWISKRGDIFRVSECPALKDKLIAGGGG